MPSPRRSARRLPRHLRAPRCACPVSPGPDSARGAGTLAPGRSPCAFGGLHAALGLPGDRQPRGAQARARHLRARERQGGRGPHRRARRAVSPSQAGGILESPLNLCITCDRSRGGEHVLGRQSIVETDLFSTCLAVQNLWLAARAEGIGVAGSASSTSRNWPRCWACRRTSIRSPTCAWLRRRLPRQPELARVGWRQRLPLVERVHGNGWGEVLGAPSLFDALAVRERSR